MPGPRPPAPILVYDRIAENQRRARWLLLLFALVCLPFLLVLLVPVGYGLVLLALPALALSGAEGGGWGAGAAGAAVGIGVAVAGIALLDLLEYRRSTRLVLRAVGARPVSREDEAELFRVVEGLCIGAGLPTPRVAIVERGGPLAFAAGLDPGSAVLVVSRPLLALLTRRELEGVVAHELSHIGNQDIRLNTLLAALVAAMRRPVESAFRRGRAAGYGCLLLSAAGFSMALLTVVGWLVAALVIGIATEGDAWAWLGSRLGEPIEAGGPEVWKVLAFEVTAAGVGLTLIGGPFYLLIGGHLLGLAVSRAVSRRRELLADADAFVLTRDAEGLATALVKLGVATGRATPADGSVAHMFIVQPETSPRAGWWEKAFPTHPLVEERVQALSRIGRVAPEALERARQEALRVRAAAPPGAPPRPLRPVVVRRSFGPLWAVGLFGSLGGAAYPVLLVPGLAALTVAALLRRVTALDPHTGEVAVWWRFLLPFGRQSWPLDRFRAVVLEPREASALSETHPGYRVALEGPSRRLVLEERLGYRKARRRAAAAADSLGFPLEDRSGRVDAPGVVSRGLFGGDSPP